MADLFPGPTVNPKLHVDGQARFNRTVGPAFVLSSGENISENRRVAAFHLSDRQRSGSLLGLSSVHHGDACGAVVKVDRVGGGWRRR